MANAPEITVIVADSSYASIDQLIEKTFFIFPGFTKMPFVWISKLMARAFLGIDTKDISPLQAIKKQDAAILLIHGAKDSQIPVWHSQLLYEEADKTELWIIPDVDHGQAHYLHPRRYESRVLGFFRKHL